MKDNKAWEWLDKNQLSYDIWDKKYRYNNETFDQWLDRVSGGNNELRRLIESKKFLFGGRALANRGTNKKGSMFNCYSSGYAPDDIEGLMQLNTNLALTYKAQGGQGLSLTKIRPKGTPIGDEFTSDGIVPFMEMFNTTTSSISQGGARKGALMMSIDIRHKEAPTFITIKTNEDKITKANLSLEIDDEFMKAVDKYYSTGETVVLHESREYNGHIVEYDITPIELYKLMIKTVYDWGEPGCIFTNRFRNYNLMEFDTDYEIATCNPCGEQPLPKNFSCNLGSLNLSEFVAYPYTRNAYFDWDEFYNAIDIAVEALDTIIDENLDRHALKEQSENSKNYRNIGLGVMGYANMLFKLGLTYGSKEAIQFTTGLFRNMMHEALLVDIDLAIDKGAFPLCKSDKIAKSKLINKILPPSDIEPIEEYGLRNCSLISIAPTGSIATMLGVSGGCEPEFALSYTRKTENLNESYDVFCKSVEEYWKLTDRTIDKGNIKSLPKYFVTSKDINWKDRIDTQSVMQDYVDTAISSTINLPKDTPIEEVEQIYLYAWEKGLKGVTIYRSGCAREGILIEESKGQENNKTNNECLSYNNPNNLPRGYVVDTSDDLVGYKRKLNTGCGSIHMEVYADELTGELQETFINIGSSGGCERNYQFISRLISTALRGGIPIEVIIDQAKSIRPCTAYVSRTKTKGDTSPGTSCPYAIGLALQDLYNKTKDSYAEDEIEVVEPKPVKQVKQTKNACPECGEPLEHEGGCVVCKTCGFSKCD